MKKHLTSLFCVLLTVVGTAQKTDSLILPKPTRCEYLKLKNTIVPYSLFMYGFLRDDVKPIRTLDVSTKNEILQHNGAFPSHIDDYMQWVPSLSLFAFDGAGFKTAHTFKQQLLLNITATAIVTGTVTPLKHITHIPRPDGSANNSFPSGHTATAFVGAEMLHQELKKNYSCLSYAGYLVATATGVYRMYNNRHWLSDVVAGAGIGILSTKFSYWIFNEMHSKKARRKQASASL